MDGDTCGRCRESRRNSEKGVYCVLFGIMLLANHEGCKYYHKEETNHEQTDDHREPDARS